MREPLEKNQAKENRYEDYTEPGVREEIAEETADRAGEADLRYRHWLAWGAFTGAIFLLVVMTIILSNAVETDWQEVTRDGDGNRYLIDYLALRWDGEQTPYAVQIAYEEPRLHHKNIPVHTILEKGSLDCQGDFTPRRRMHLAVDQDLLYLENADTGDGIPPSMMPDEVRDRIRQHLCRRR